MTFNNGVFRDFLKPYLITNTHILLICVSNTSCGILKTHMFSKTSCDHMNRNYCVSLKQYSNYILISAYCVLYHKLTYYIVCYLNIMKLFLYILHCFKCVWDLGLPSHCFVYYKLMFWPVFRIISN